MRFIWLPQTSSGSFTSWHSMPILCSHLWAVKRMWAGKPAIFLGCAYERAVDSLNREWQEWAKFLALIKTALYDCSRAPSVGLYIWAGDCRIVYKTFTGCWSFRPDLLISLNITGPAWIDLLNKTSHVGSDVCIEAPRVPPSLESLGSTSDWRLLAVCYSHRLDH